VDQETRPAVPAVTERVAPRVEVAGKKGSGRLVWALVAGVLMMVGAFGALGLSRLMVGLPG
jgi:hypothetical protein